MKLISTISFLLSGLSSIAQVGDTIQLGWNEQQIVLRYPPTSKLKELTTNISYEAGVSAFMGTNAAYRTWTWKDLKIQKLTAPRIDVVLYSSKSIEIDSTNIFYVSLHHHETGENLTSQLINGSYPLVETWLTETIIPFLREEEEE